VQLATRLCHELALSTEQLHVWGGESTVQLPATPGRGGRNQHLALAAARLLVSHAGMAMLAVATDGTDGSTPDAGGLVDGGTIERGTLDGLDVDESLGKADSGTFLEAAGDLVHTGPTGTNVGDLVLGYKVR
jgi:hydroxypyruvate reductase